MQSPSDKQKKSKAEPDGADYVKLKYSVTLALPPSGCKRFHSTKSRRSPKFRHAWRSGSLSNRTPNSGCPALRRARTHSYACGRGHHWGFDMPSGALVRLAEIRKKH